MEIADADLARLEPPTDERVPVRLTVDGETMDRAGVRLKAGGAQYQGLDAKPGFSIKTDEFVEGQDTLGVARFTLGNAALDDSFVAEHLAYRVFRDAGVPVARTALARVTLNDEAIGLYVMRESYDKRWLTRNFEDPEGNLYEAPDDAETRDTELEATHQRAEQRRQRPRRHRGRRRQRTRRRVRGPHRRARRRGRAPDLLGRRGRDRPLGRLPLRRHRPRACAPARSPSGQPGHQQLLRLPRPRQRPAGDHPPRRRPHLRARRHDLGARPDRPCAHPTEGQRHDRGPAVGPAGIPGAARRSRPLGHRRGLGLVVADRRGRADGRPHPGRRPLRDTGTGRSGEVRGGTRHPRGWIRARAAAVRAELAASTSSTEPQRER